MSMHFVCRGTWVGQLIDTNQPVEVNGRTVLPDDVLEDRKKSQIVLGKYPIRIALCYI